MWYITHTPRWLRAVFPRRVMWQGDATDRRVYLTFDDGPHPEATGFVLDQLAQFGFPATFFCIGENVLRHPEVLDEIRKAGHTVGNHTMRHVNGWQCSAPKYLQDIAEADKLIGSRWFRPPFGKITRKQVGMIEERFPDMQVVMWSVLSGDFDTRRSGEWCAGQVMRHTRPGSLIVFHDSAKALPRLRVALPMVLEFLKREGYRPASL